MKIISIFLGKIVLILCKKLGRGSAFPGTFVYKINKKILSQFKKPKTVIAVTGSSGKGSTTRLIADVYKQLGYKVEYNDKGSNERSAIITTLLENSTLTGKSKVDVAIFEMDERYVKYVFPYFSPNYVVINNITRDQPPRQRHFDFVLSEIEKGLNKDMHLIINADDPYLQKLNINNNYNITYFGIDKLKNSYVKNKFPALNISRCLKCHNSLNYNYYHIEYLGDYYCPKCDFKRPNAEYKITEFKGKKITINNKYNITINNDMLFNLYNSLGAFTTLALQNIPLDKASEIISKINEDTKIYNSFKYLDRNVYVLNNKNENATTFNQSVLYTSNDKKLKTIVIGWWQISRRYDFDDLSWLYDIEFELLNNDKTYEFIVCGPQRYDIAVRLKYANVNTKKIKIYNDLYEAKNEIKKSKGSIYAILNFDYLKPFNDIMKG